MILIQLLAVFAFEIEQPFIPGIIIAKSNNNGISKDFDMKEPPMKDYKPKEIPLSNNREYEHVNSQRFNPVLRTILITRGVSSPFARSFRQNRGFEEKDNTPFVNEREAPFNHDYPNNQSYYPFYYDHVPAPRRRVSQRSIDDIVKGKNGTIPSNGNGVMVFKILLILIFLLISGLIGFYFGKIQESRNYVRVGIPHNN